MEASAARARRPRRSPRHDILFEPVRIGPHTLRNRFYQVPHCTGFGVQKPWTQARFRGTKAEGGWAAVCTEYCSISPETDDAPYASARLWDDEDARALALTVEEAHAHGALAGVELWHGGFHVENRESRLAPMAPSAIPSDWDTTSVPRAMTLDDIRRVRREWVAAARRAAGIGFDIVYVYGAHRYLLSQFLSPVMNRRTDAYGGSFENRARLWLETLEEVRAAVGDRCAIAVRVAGDTLALSGVEIEESLAFIRAADHLVDLWDVVIGGLAGMARLDSGPSRFFAQGYQLEWTGRAREATAKPIVGVGRLTDPDRMAEIVSSGVWDLIGAARPSIADPFLPRKIEEGRYDEIRECIGCNACYARSIHHGHLGCTQNATAGEEHRRGWHPERFAPTPRPKRDVLVVGAGPSGMEAAIVLGKRGYRRVHLVDAGEDVGGAMSWIRRLPGLAEWGRLVDWRRIQLSRLRNVEVILGERLDAEGIRTYGADAVLLATGARWAGDGRNAFDMGPIPGADAALPHVLTPEQVLVEGKPVPGRRVAVLDHEGYFVGPGVAERLRLDGHEVAIVTGHDHVAPVMDQTLEGPRLRRHLHGLGVAQHRGIAVSRIAPGGLVGEDEHGAPWELEADAVVLVTQRVPSDALFAELDADRDALAGEGVETLLRVGDCVAPRLLADAIFDGHRVARELDEERPEGARPYRRELPLP